MIRRLGEALTRFAIEHARLVTWTMVGSTVALLALALAPTLAPETFPMLHGVAVDTDPENMLPADEPARVLHRRIKEDFAIHDGVVLGLVNERHPDGVFNVETLTQLHALSHFAKGLEGVVPHEVLSLATVDDIAHEGAGTLRFRWLFETPPKDAEEARQIGVRAQRIPFIRDSLVSADGQVAILFVPLEDKRHAHDVWASLQDRIAELGPGDTEHHFAGLPVAEELFGIEMFKQMAISAPVAMALIFALMWLFFRQVQLIIAPMIVAVVAALSTMATLVATGNTIHIMSSMIPIFIMPIAVLDSVHIISDFFEHYQRTGDRKKTMMLVMEELSLPMLFTSLTTSAGFASLALTPIPPVQVFGIFIALGVMLTWFWTVTFVPAWIALMPRERLERFGRPATEEDRESRLARFFDELTFRKARRVIVATLALVGVAVWGIGRIEINDNPTRWFEPSHPIRVADDTLNRHFGGTYDVYLTLEATEGTWDPAAHATGLRTLAEREQDAIARVLADVRTLAADDGGPDDALDALDALDEAIRRRRRSATELELVGWGVAGDLLDAAYARTEEADPAPGGVALRARLRRDIDERSTAVAAAYDRLRNRIDLVGARGPSDAASFLAAIAGSHALPAGPYAAAFAARVAQSDELFKDPRALAWLETLEGGLATMTGVGKTNSLAGLVKTVHRDLTTGLDTDLRIPARRAMVAQTLEQLGSSHRKDDVWHFVTPDFRRAVIWIQLTSADNQVMGALQGELDVWLAENPPPAGVDPPVWSGLTYINGVWQEKMVTGMLEAFLGSFAVVLVMMMLLFRSVLWGLLSMVPLTVTVGLTYGVLGIIGKDYDMPVAVLSSLSLGLAVDYAIHFIARARELQARHGSWSVARAAVFAEPARAIGRNVIVLGVGFTPLILAPLVPYQTVGVLIAALLLLAGAGTLLILPALIALMRGPLFGEGSKAIAAPSALEGALP